MIFFFVHFQEKWKKQEKCIILMYCLYESINKHNADIDFFVHVATSVQDCRNSKFGQNELYEPQESPINSASFGCRVVILSAFLLRNSI